MQPIRRFKDPSWPFTLVFVGIVLFFFLPLILFCGIAIFFAIYCIVKSGRQRMVLALIHTAMESGTPVYEVLKAYARGCWGPWYPQKVKNFAVGIEHGDTMLEARRIAGDVLRYDIAGAIDLGGSTAETARTLEAALQENRSQYRIQTDSLVRMSYLLLYCFPAIFLYSTGIFLYIIPKFEQIFMDFDTEFPPVTATLLWTAKMIVRYWFILSPICTLGIVVPFLYFLMQSDIVTIRPWLLRYFVARTDSARFLRLLATGFSLKKPIEESINTYLAAVPSRYLYFKARNYLAEVEKGADWISELLRLRYITDGEAGLLRSAVRTENVPEMLRQIIDTKENQQIISSDFFSRMVFIVCILVFGGIVAFVSIGCFAPLTELIKVLT